MEQKTTYPEKQLLAGVAEGNHQDFAKLLTDYHSVPYRTAMRLLDDTSLAEDVVQDVFLKVWLKRETLSSIDNFRAWLITTTTHVIYDMLRRKSTEKNHLSALLRDTELFSQLPAPLAGEGSAYDELLSEAMLKLSPKQLQVVTLIKKEGYSREETARLMNVSPETVKSHLEQAMRTIRAYCMSRLGSGVILVLLSFIRQKYS